MAINQRELILRLINLTASGKIIWHDLSDVTMKNNFCTHYEEYSFETLSLVNEPAKLYVKSKHMEIMIIDDTPLILCDLICAIYAQGRRLGITVKSCEDDIEEGIQRMNDFIEAILENISS